MLVVKEVPNQFVPPDALREGGDAKLVVGRKLATSLRAGQILQWVAIEVEGSRGGLSSMIPAGEGAFTVPISRGIKTGLIQGGDHIDIIGSFAVPKGGQPVPESAATWRLGSDMVNVVLLQNVTVLNVGDSLASGRGDTGGGDVTLSLTLRESQMLMFASEHGQLGAVLRREGSTETLPRAELPTVTFEEIMKVIGDLDGLRKVRMVEVESGSKLESVPVRNASTDKQKSK
jgi:Flp pilus assembly protein CpaB